MIRYKFWTEKEDKLLRKLYPQYIRGDISREELAKVFKRTIGSVWGRARALGLMGKTFDDIDEEYLRELKRQGRVKI